MKNMTKIEVAERLRITPRTLENWHRQGIGPARMVLGSGAVLYREADVIAFEEGKAEGGAITPAAKKAMTRSAEAFDMILRWRDLPAQTAETIQALRDELRGLAHPKKEAA